jgi:hypothetical protein
MGLLLKNKLSHSRPLRGISIRVDSVYCKRTCITIGSYSKQFLCGMKVSMQSQRRMHGVTYFEQKDTYDASMIFDLIFKLDLFSARAHYLNTALQRQFRLYIPFLGIAWLSPNFYIHVSVSDLYSIFPGSVHIFPPAETAAPSWEYNSLTDT